MSLQRVTTLVVFGLTLAVALSSSMLGNAANGIQIVGTPTGNDILGNAIAFNGAAGLLKSSASDTKISGNTFVDNGGLGIDVGSTGPSPAPSSHHAVPLLSSVDLLTNTVSGTVQSEPNDVVDLEFFTGTSCDPSGYGEGHTYLGTGSVPTDGTGFANFSIVVAPNIGDSEFITATATGATLGTSEFSLCFATPIATGIETEIAMPSDFVLYPAYPNPFNPVTTVAYDIAVGGSDVTIKIYDVAGRLVRTLVDDHQAAGRMTAIWSGRNERGQQVASGVYFYRMRAQNFNQTQKIVLMK